MEIRAQIAREWIEELRQVSEENAILMRETVTSAFVLSGLPAFDGSQVGLAGGQAQRWVRARCASCTQQGCWQGWQSIRCKPVCDCARSLHARFKTAAQSSSLNVQGNILAHPELVQANEDD
jgi:hypothetical protein